MKIIFLDFDGVLNSQEFFKRLREGKVKTNDKYKCDLDKSKVIMLNEIVKKTNAKIVISSFWRYIYKFETLQKILKKHGFKYKIYDVTPFGAMTDRWKQIQEWIDSCKENIEDFIIIDDEKDHIGYLKNKLVLTDFSTGLTQEHVNEIITRLK